MEIIAGILIVIYWISVVICLFGSLKKVEGVFDFIVSVVLSFLPPLNMLMVLEVIIDYFEKPKQIKIFHEKVAKIRELIRINQVESAKDLFYTLGCPSDELEREYKKIKNEVDNAMAKYNEAKRQREEEEKRQKEIREEEQRRQQREKERVKRQQHDALVRSGEILDSLSPQDFELEILKAFSQQGYKTTHTSFTGDEGVDGFIKKGNKKIAIQCKKYSGSIGQPAIRDFYGAMMHFECDEGIFITTSDFSSQAKAFAENKNIQLFNRQETLNLLQSTLNNDYKEYICPILKAEFVLIPAGTFMMGSPEDEPERDNNETLHRVTISKPFYLQTTPVTQEQWKRVMGDDPSHFKDYDDYPVECVSWDDVQEFIWQLNQQEGTDKYSLPTEAQWEYAARAGSQSDRYGDIDDIAWYEGNSGKETHVVRQKRPNAWGLYDMLGNVWEWCQDWYGDYPSGSVTDPVGPDSYSSRVYRGGSWNSDAKRCRAANRNSYYPGYRNHFLGFRLARTH